MAKLTDTGKKIIGTIVAVVVIGGGITMFKPKTPASAPAPAAPAVTQQVEVPASAPAVQVTPVQEVQEAPAPVKKHPMPHHTAGHAVKHAPEKHQHSTKSTQHHSSSTSTHSTKPNAEENALKELANEKL